VSAQTARRAHLVDPALMEGPSGAGAPESGRALVLNAGAVRRPLCVSETLVGEKGDVVTGLGADETHRPLVARLAEEPLAGP
jgi:hypothetical protein